MTKFYAATLALVAGLSTPAFANVADANGDGLLTMDEVQAVYPEITTDGFTAMDLNADGALDADEVLAAQEAGLMPAS
jgi:hypothetical protein